MGNKGINNYAWQKLRRQWADRIAMSAALNTPIICPKCHRPITVDEPWDLGHQVDRADGGTNTDSLPEHSACNRSAGAIRSHGPRRRRW